MQDEVDSCWWESSNIVRGWKGADVWFCAQDPNKGLKGGVVDRIEWSANGGNRSVLCSMNPTEAKEDHSFNLTKLCLYHSRVSNLNESLLSASSSCYRPFLSFLGHLLLSISICTKAQLSLICHYQPVQSAQNLFSFTIMAQILCLLLIRRRALSFIVVLLNSNLN